MRSLNNGDGDVHFGPGLSSCFTVVSRGFLHCGSGSRCLAAQIAQAFQGWNESDPRWRAQWDLLSNELEGALTNIAQTKSTPEELARWAGRVEMIVHWRAQLLGAEAGRGRLRSEIKV
jgi:hypothetical protein